MSRLEQEFAKFIDDVLPDIDPAQRAEHRQSFLMGAAVMTGIFADDVMTAKTVDDVRKAVIAYADEGALLAQRDLRDLGVN